MIGIPIRGTAKGSAGAAFTIAKRRGAKRLDFLLAYLTELYAFAPHYDIDADVLVAQLLEVHMPSMKCRMLRLRHHLKILGAIVRSIVIDVMNHFITTKVAPDLCLRHKAMFGDIPGLVRVGVSGNLDVDVPLAPIDKPGWSVRKRAASLHRFVVATPRAKALSPRPEWLRFERGAAHLALPNERRIVKWINALRPVRAGSGTVLGGAKLCGSHMELRPADLAGDIGGKMAMHAMAFHRVPRPRRLQPRGVIPLPQLYPSNRRNRGEMWAFP